MTWLRIAFALALIAPVSGCAVFQAKTPAEKTVALIRDARAARDVAAQGCALYRAGVALGEVPPDPVATAACDEAFPVGGKT